MRTILPAILLLLAIGCQNAADSNTAVAVKEEEPNYALLQAELEETYDLDQGVRDVNWDSVNATPGVQQEFMKQMRQVDSLNQAKVLPILDRYGWLPKSKIGEKAADALFVVVQHASLNTIEKYLPEMEELALQGEASTADAAMMRDRLLMFQGKKQRYGTQVVSYIREDGRAAVWPVEDVKNVNKRRAAAGFELTVEENAKRLGAVFDPEEKLPEEHVSF
ncbi:DUF6624 domain-containing protein [Pontibacter actiniarum]|uniref:Uncharacterized protein n=1 Tax=Pontibacter actiniarum TaxID=323450 RepID=A0A1X9YTU3_9BACT|nr:DUF6624 domain-containing protein [Pontibacter actiniarum]ARS36340.1 hypothetical protein CA264_13350 [Pontibacter actiniarum]